MNFRKSNLFIISALYILFIAGCSGSTERDTPDSSVQTLTVNELADILANHPDDYTIINVHIPYNGEIEGTDLHIPYNDIPALTSALPNKDTAIILYCGSGSMSAQASEALIEQGYTRVWDLSGGMSAWKASGHEILDQDG